MGGRSFAVACRSSVSSILVVLAHELDFFPSLLGCCLRIFGSSQLFDVAKKPREVNLEDDVPLPSYFKPSSYEVPKRGEDLGQAIRLHLYAVIEPVGKAWVGGAEPYFRRVF